MSGLPSQIPPQNVPLGVEIEGQLYVAFNWYLFFYNLAQEVLGTPGSGGNAASSIDLADMVALSAATADIPQAWRQIANQQAVEALGIIPDGSDIADLRHRIANLQVLVASLLLPDPPARAGAVIPLAPGASPFTYTAIHDGVMFVSGSVSTTIALSRYGVNVPMGLSDGTIPMRESDQLTFTWSGGTPPTLNYLPNR